MPVDIKRGGSVSTGTEESRGRRQQGRDRAEGGKMTQRRGSLEGSGHPLPIHRSSKADSNSRMTALAEMAHSTVYICAGASHLLIST